MSKTLVHVRTIRCLSNENVHKDEKNDNTDVRVYMVDLSNWSVVQRIAT